jgi:hypothetical protein
MGAPARQPPGELGGERGAGLGPPGVHTGPGERARWQAPAGPTPPGRCPGASPLALTLSPRGAAMRRRACNMHAASVSIPGKIGNREPPAPNP